MTTASELDDVGRVAVENYIHAGKSRVQKCVRELDIEFQGYRDGNVLSDTYTRDEVDSMLQGYFAVLQATLHKQHETACLTHASTIAQVLKNGDDKGARLEGMPNKLDDPDLEKCISMLEDELARKEAPKSPPTAVARPEVDLAAALAEAKDETKRLKEKARDIQDQFNAMMRDKTAVQSMLNQELDVLKSIKDVGSTPSEAALQQLRDEVKRLEAETDVARKEAGGKITDSSQFQTIKSLIQKKNSETKSIRERLEKFQQEANDDDGDD